MNLSEFESYLDIHGSRWERWPDHLRQDAQTFLQEHEEAKLLYAEAVQLDSILGVDQPIKAPPSLRRRILASTLGLSTNTNDWLGVFLTRLWRPAAAALVPLCLGFSVGFFDQEPINELEQEISTLSFTDFETLAGVYDEP